MMIKRIFILLLLVGFFFGIGQLLKTNAVNTAYACDGGSQPASADQSGVGPQAVNTPVCVVNTPTASPSPSPTVTPTLPIPVPDYFCINTNVDHGMYINDFERATPGAVGWSDYRHEVAPNGFQFLGQYGNDRLTLTVGCLPAHTAVYLSFDLYIIRSWDGNVTHYTKGEPVGPDHWKLSVQDGQTLLDTTFANWPTFPNKVNFTQAYPGNFPTGSYPAETGSVAFGRLGYKSFGVSQDSDYHISRMIPHVGDGISTGTYITLVFEGSGLQPLYDESWGLDNVMVTTDSLYNSLTSSSYYLPALFR